MPIFNDRRGHNGDRRRGFIQHITDMVSDALGPYTGNVSDRTLDILAPTTVPRKPGTPHPLSGRIGSGRSTDSVNLFGQTVDMSGYDTSTGIPIPKKQMKKYRRQAKKTGWY
ncbi:hypothetical protein UFOVP221_44 [uncultured Caudovirales phage]|uniref:Uncharacterized protein n=1 Tax=uncultured Caudovirales phage TaxID=2100421 RepID=A0A6J7WSY3_9CAUD|nr:hypothetical protein UFOVP221_44 [uncultured Caudovirales phage]